MENTRQVELRIGDAGAAIRYLGEMQSRPMDPIHEPIQNLLDERAARIDIEIDQERREIRVRGDARPITQVQEAQRILSSLCASTKVGKLGEKGIGLLSFVNVATAMTMTSQKDGRTVFLRLRKDDLTRGEVGSGKGNRLPYAGTEVRLSGVSTNNLRFRFNAERVIKDIKRRWASFLSRGVTMTVNGQDVSTSAPPLEGEAFSRDIAIHELGPKARIEVRLILLEEPSDSAAVSVTHRGQANFLVTDIPLFEGRNAFASGMINGSITGDLAALNASRDGFKDGPEVELWIERVIDLEAELARIIERRMRAAIEARDAQMLADWMRHLREVFRGTELATTPGGLEPGRRPIGADETERDDDGPTEAASTPRVPTTGRGRLPTIPNAEFTQAAPHIRVVRERRSFKINVNHPDFIRAAKSRERRQYIRELCVHEAYIYSLEGKSREWYVERSDEFLGYWVRAFV